MFDGLDSGVQPLFIAPKDLVHWIDRVRPHMEKMASGSGDRYAATDLISAVAAGRMLLWIAVEGASVLCVLVSEVHQYPQLRAMRLIGLVGHQPFRWRGLLPLVEKAARDKFGCSRMEAFHQARHIALMPGYRTVHWFSEKEVA